MNQGPYSRRGGGGQSTVTLNKVTDSIEKRTLKIVMQIKYSGLKYAMYQTFLCYKLESMQMMQFK